MSIKKEKDLESCMNQCEAKSHNSFFFTFYSMNAPTVVEPNGIFNKICDAAVSPLGMLLNE